MSSMPDWPLHEIAALAARWAAGDPAAGWELLEHRSVKSYVGHIVRHEGKDDPDVAAEVQAELLGYFARKGSTERERVGAVVRHTIKRLRCPSDLVLTSTERRVLHIADAVSREAARNGQTDRQQVVATVKDRARAWAAERTPHGTGDEIDAKMVKSGMARALKDIDGLLTVAGRGRRLDEPVRDEDGTPFGELLVAADGPTTPGTHDETEDVNDLRASLLQRVLSGVEDSTVHAIELLADTGKKDRRSVGARNLAAATGLTQTQAATVKDRLRYRLTCPHQMWAFLGPVDRQFDNEPVTFDELLAWRLHTTSDTTAKR